MPQQTNNLTGTTGEYYVCAELGRHGVLALLTPKNNPLFDIVAVNPDASRMVSIQVKTMSQRNKQGWKLGMDICTQKNNSNLFTVLVNLTSKQVDYYIFEYDYLSKKVQTLYSNYLSKPKRNGEQRKDIAFRWLDLKDFTQEDKIHLNNWELLGFKKYTYESI